VVAALVGAGLGLVVATMTIGQLGLLRGWPTWISGRPGQALRPPIGLTVLWPSVGLGIVLWGVTRGSLQLALVGLPLIALGGFWYLIKRNMRG
jgi:hypothetical protein